MDRLTLESPELKVVLDENRNPSPPLSPELDIHDVGEREDPLLAVRRQDERRTVRRVADELRQLGDGFDADFQRELELVEAGRAEPLDWNEFNVVAEQIVHDFVIYLQHDPYMFVGASIAFTAILWTQTRVAPPG